MNYTMITKQNVLVLFLLFSTFCLCKGQKYVNLNYQIFGFDTLTQGDVYNAISPKSGPIGPDKCLKDFELNSAAVDAVNLWGTRFYGTFTLKQILAIDYIFIWHGRFDKGTIIDSTELAGGVKFDSCYWGGGFRISNSQITTRASFKKSIFEKQVHIENSSVDCNFDFSDCQFSRSLTFKNIEAGDKFDVIFNNSVLPDTIFLNTNTGIANEIDLTVANYNDSSRWERYERDWNISDKDHFRNFRANKYYKKIVLNFYRSDISKFHLEYPYFKLLLIDPENGEKLSKDETTAIFEALLKNFKDHGQLLSYELCDVDYKDYIWHNRPLYIRWFGKISKAWNNYGYAKERVFGWILLFLAVFTIITYRLFDPLSRDVYPISNIPKQPLLKYVDLSPTGLKHFRNRLWYSFVYTAIVFFLFSMKVEKINYSKKDLVAYLMVVYTTGIVCLAYMANYVITR